MALSALCSSRPPPACAVVVASDGRAVSQSPRTNLVFPDAALDLARFEPPGGNTPGASLASASAAAETDANGDHLGSSLGAGLDPNHLHSGRSHTYRPLWALGLGLGISGAQVSSRS